jgi:hypothetical protein
VSESAKISLTTNVCPADDVRIRHTLPSWLRVFGARLGEVIVVVDEEPPTGRIAKVHRGYAKLNQLYDELALLEKLDRRVRIKVLDPSSCAEPTLKKWFGETARPIRCQAGTPILAFVQAFEEAQGPIILRADCDMLFYETGWLDEAIKLLTTQGYDLVEPGRAGEDPLTAYMAVTSRALMMDQRTFAKKLPLLPHKLDLARRLHRWLQGRPSWLAFEQMLEEERQAGRLRYKTLDSRLGFGLHVATRQEASLAWFGQVVPFVERGELPPAQLAQGQNFAASAWENFVNV